MKARLGLVLSRSYLVGTLAAVSVFAAGCSGAPSGAAPAPAATAVAPATATATAEAQPAARHAPADWLFQKVESLDLREDQRAAIAGIRENLAAELTPHREVLRQLVSHLADAIEAGRLDATRAAEERVALSVTIGQAKLAFAAAMNGVHDTLDPAQRVALIQLLRAEHERRGRGADAQHSSGLTKLAFQLGLTADQQAKIADAWSNGLDEVFPERKARREEHEAKMKAMAEAFVTDEFDAADYDFASHADEAVGSGLQVATRGVDVTTRVLSVGQRQLAADWLRLRAAEL